MSIISKSLAEQISIKLTEKSRQASDTLHFEYREMATVAYEETVPEEIRKCFKKYPDFFDSNCSLKINGNGFNWEYVSATRPVISNSGQRGVLEPNAKLAERLSRAKHKWEDAQEKYKLLRKETEVALLTLKTYNNIRKELPLAAPMLPPPLSNALVCNFDSLKKKLSTQPDNKKVLTN